MVGKGGSRRQQPLFVKGLLVIADTLVQFLFSIFSNGAVGNLQHTLAKEVYGVIVHLVICADKTLSYSLINEFQYFSLPVFRTSGQHAQGDLLAKCGGLV